MASETKNSKILLEQIEAIRRIGQQFQAVVETINRVFDPQILLIKEMQAILKPIELQRKYFEEISKRLVLPTISLEIIRASPVLKSIKEFRESYEKLAEPFMRLQTAIKLKSPITLPKIETIRPLVMTTIDELLAHIDALEGELAKEREKNKELLEMLKKMKGEIEKERPSYIG